MNMGLYSTHLLDNFLDNFTSGCRNCMARRCRRDDAGSLPSRGNIVLNLQLRFLCSVEAVKNLPVHIVSTVFSKIIRYRYHAVMITCIMAIRSTLFGVAPASSDGCVVEIAWLGAVAVTVWVRSPSRGNIVLNI
jgi:hypothetical protein